MYSLDVASRSHGDCFRLGEQLTERDGAGKRVLKACRSGCSWAWDSVKGWETGQPGEGRCEGGGQGRCSSSHPRGSSLDPLGSGTYDGNREGGSGGVSWMLVARGGDGVN